MVGEHKMKKDMLKLVGLARVSVPLLFGCDKVKNYSYETVQSYMGGTVTDVWAETKVEHSGSGIGKTSWTEDICRVSVKFEDGEVVTLTDNVNPVYCYKLEVGDWVDGWMNEEIRKNLEIGEVDVRKSWKGFNILKEVSKRVD